MTPSQRRAAVTHVQASAAIEQPISERQACRYLGVHRALCRYRSRRSPEAELRTSLRELAAAHPRWGVPASRGGSGARAS